MGIKELSYGVERTSTTSAARAELLQKLLMQNESGNKKSKRAHRSKRQKGSSAA